MRNNEKKIVTMEAEIIAFDRDSGTMRLEMDSGHEGRMHWFHLEGRTEVERKARYDALREEDILTVKVIGIREKFGRPDIFKLAERLDVPVEAAPRDVTDDCTAVPAEPDPELVARFRPKQNVRAMFHHINGQVIHVRIGDTPARLHVTELNGKKVQSLRPNVNINARVLRVDGMGVWLTCREIA